MFVTLSRTHSVTQTAAICLVSQPAVTQAIRKLESEAGIGLFLRPAQGLFPTAAGAYYARRAARALALLDEATADMQRAARLQATRAQLAALIAVVELENFTLAARQLGLAQPTVHRSVTLLEQSAGVRFFERTAHGLIATRAARALAHAARLAFAELDQAAAELGEMAGREVGRIVIGALPLSRSGLLPRALLAFRRQRPTFPFEVIDGPYDELLSGLRRGEIDLVVGALRLPAPIPDVTQERLFDDSVAIVARHGHPLLSGQGLTGQGIGPAALARYPWVMARRTTPLRRTIDAFLAPYVPHSLIETSSLIMLREILRGSDHLGALSRMQAQEPGEAQALAILPVEVPHSLRPIGITTRAGWEPTAVQRDFIDILRQVAGMIG